MPLLALAGLGLALLIAGAAILQMRSLYDDAIANTHKSLTSLATVLADQADRSIQAIELIQNSVTDEILDGSVQTQEDYVARISTRAMHDSLKARVAALPQINAVTLIDETGKLRNFSRYWPIPDVNIADRDYFKALSPDPSLRNFVSRPFPNRGDGTWTIYVARKVTAPNGGFLGLILGAVELKSFEKLYETIAPQEGDVVSMFRTDGVLVARYPYRPGDIGKSFPEAGPLRILADSPSGSGSMRLRSPVDGADRLVSTSRLRGYPLLVSVSRTSASALSSWRGQAAAMGFAVTVLLIGLGATVVLVARQARAQERLARAETARCGAEERERGERVLREQYQRFGTAFDSMTQGLCLFDAADRLIVMNARFACMYDVPAQLQQAGTLVGALGAHLVAATGQSLGLETGRAGEAPRRATTLVHDLAGGRSVSVSSALVPAGGWVSTHEDVTERRKTDAKIAHLAQHDPLTDLPNRLVLKKRMEQLLAKREGEGERGALLLLDLDGFKQVNDTHGHLAGDELLRLVSRRLLSRLADVNLLARLGGDEFAVVLDDAGGAARASALAAQLIADLKAPFSVSGSKVFIGTSVGIAMADPDVSSPERLLRNADIALYRAKDAGRGTWCLFETRMDAEIRERSALEAALRQALAERQFVLHYQPLYNSRSGRLTGFEALVRWQHPERGLVGPDRFIPLCEENGLISELGSWVLHQACQDAALWPAHIKVAVNLSPAQFRTQDLVGRVTDTLSETGLPAGRLELEITETVLLQDDQANLLTLQALHDLGVRIAMDDFGTGYSSLSYMRSFPFDKIKVDRCFLADLPARNGNVAIVRAAIGLGKALGIRVLAEGVETSEQVAFLQREGCDELQGFLLGKPAPLHVATELARADAAHEAVAPAAAFPARSEPLTAAA